MMTTHELKTWPDYFQALADGEKTCEVRLDDRGYSVGDLLHLREWDPSRQDYTGRDLRLRVTHVLLLGNLRAPFGDERWGPHVALSLAPSAGAPRFLEVGYCEDCCYWREEPSRSGLGSTARAGLCQRFTDNLHCYGKVVLVPNEDPSRPVRFETGPGFGCEAWA